MQIPELMAHHLPERITRMIVGSTETLVVLNRRSGAGRCPGIVEQIRPLAAWCWGS